jgi:hypothetical protein
MWGLDDCRTIPEQIDVAGAVHGVGIASENSGSGPISSLVSTILSRHLLDRVGPSFNLVGES